jgi:arylamine N-acetyltransferase
MTPDHIAAYLDRLRLDTAPPATLAGLDRLQTAHRQAIAFENLDVRLGRPIRIDSASVFDKLVTRRRGGYCFEQNRLYSDMLTTLGISNRPLLARVRLGMSADVVPPRTHVLLLVELEGERWIADAGFGGSNVPPLPLQDGASAQTDDGAAHRLRRIGLPGDLSGEWLLERAGPVAATDGRAAPHGDWQPQYAFDLSPVDQVDLEQCNHWTSTRPETRFTTLHIVSRPLAGGFASLVERSLSFTRDGANETREIASAADYRALLGGTFGLAISEQEAASLPLFSA